MRALSMDLRTRILSAVQEGTENMRQIAERFAVIPLVLGTGTNWYW